MPGRSSGSRSARRPASRLHDGPRLLRRRSAGLAVRPVAEAVLTADQLGLAVHPLPRVAADGAVGGPLRDRRSPLDHGQRHPDEVAAAQALDSADVAVRESASLDPAPLDAADPLAPFRDRFVIADPELIYLDGNSLGRLPAATAARLARVVGEEWGGELIRGWDHWLDEPLRVGDRLAEARPRRRTRARSSSATRRRSTSTSWRWLPWRRSRHARRRDRRPNFPTDRYVLGGSPGHRGLEIAWLEPDPIEATARRDSRTYRSVGSSVCRSQRRAVPVSLQGSAGELVL